MTIKQLTETVSVSGQVRLADLPVLARQFRTIVNNRPDGEEVGQPDSAQLQEEARRLGLRYEYIPVVGQPDDAQADAFGRVVSEAPAPVLAFCRSGARSSQIWALSEAGKSSINQIIRVAESAGYDLQSLRAQLEQRSARRDP